MSLLTEIDHVAIAVNDLEAAIAWYQEVFGATVDHRERVESDGVEEALLKVADSYIQLLTPISDTSPVAKYLANKGEGLHHIGYRVDDCARGAPGHQGCRRPCHRRGPPPGLPGHHRGLRAPQDLIRHPDRTGPGVGDWRPYERRDTSTTPPGLDSAIQTSEPTPSKARGVACRLRSRAIRGREDGPHGPRRAVSHPYRALHHGHGQGLPPIR